MSRNSLLTINITESEFLAQEWLSSASARASITSFACCNHANFFPLMSNLSVSSINPERSIAPTWSTVDG